MQPTDADDADLPTCWAVPLDEPAALMGQSPQTDADTNSGVILSFPFREADVAPEVGFHPRLRRFDEAA